MTSVQALALCAVIIFKCYQYRFHLVEALILQNIIMCED